MTPGQFIIKPQQKLPSILQCLKGHTYDGVGEEKKKKKAGDLTLPGVRLPLVKVLSQECAVRGADGSGKWQHQAVLL